MDFINGEALLALCAAENIPISQVMLQREMYLGNMTKEQVYERMARSIEIMRASTRGPIAEPVQSMGGLLGGESQAVWNHAFEANLLLRRLSAELHFPRLSRMPWQFWKSTLPWV